MAEEQTKTKTKTKKNDFQQQKFPSLLLSTLPFPSPWSIKALSHARTAGAVLSVTGQVHKCVCAFKSVWENWELSSKDELLGIE